MKKVVVIGSLNVDMMISTLKLPKVGETIHGIDSDYLIGGKGANQAVAAARLGAPTQLIGNVGQDTFGSKVLDHLAREKHLDISKIRQVDASFTGIATVFKLPTDNAIVVIPGANNLLDNQAIDERIDFDAPAILLSQLEVPLNTILYAFEKGKQTGTINILNPAPYQAIPDEAFAVIDYLTPNETEFSELVGQEIHSQEELAAAMLAWSSKHQTTLVVTCGKDGCAYVEDGTVKYVAGNPVKAVDTTGAGDTFNGALAYGLANDYSLEKSIELANKAAAIAVQSIGAQTGMPTLAQIKGEK